MTVPLQQFIERLIWLCMLPLIVLGTVLVGAQMVVLEQRRDLLAQSVGRSAVQATNQFLHVRISSLQLLADMLEDLAPQSAHPDIHHLHRVSWHFVQQHGTHVVLSDDTGQMLMNTRTPPGHALPRMPSPAGRSSVASALESGQAEVGDAFVGPVVQREMVSVAVPLKAPWARPVVLSSLIETTDLQPLVDIVDLPPDWSISLRDSTGQVLAYKGPKSSHPSPLTADPSASSSLRSLPVAQARWTVVVDTASTGIFGSRTAEIALLLLALSATVGVGYLAGHISSQRLRHAIASLVASPGVRSLDPSIAEVEQVRHQLKDLAHERERAEAQIRAVFDSAADAILCFDNDGRIILANAAASHLRGLSLNELLGGRIEEWIVPAQRSLLQRELTRLHRSEADHPPQPISRRRMETQRADGSVVPVEMSISRVTVDGAPLNAAILHDLTRRERYQRRLRELLRDRQSVQEIERRRIGLELHDDLQQRLAMLRHDLIRLQGRTVSADSETVDRAQLALRQVDEAIVSTRRLVDDLRPQVLDDLGLPAALESMLLRLEGQYGIKGDLQVLGEAAVAELASDFALGVYRVAQEALNNVIKHAHATIVTVCLDCSRPGQLTLEVVDDGLGFDPLVAGNGHQVGLSGMQDRAVALGGTLRVESRNGDGTAVILNLPLPPAVKGSSA